ncbi:hypothetical protein AVEN_207964-1 [Araneus ventricosus]|uniref:Uncharacterized protein n=1 Tax=Araneus ventricosus TaxID=182803 RepID=A0A4Y2MIG0_ARAVE|nr:hypothetical protein AVEN_207964-1 [Araneus ventricosus]
MQNKGHGGLVVRSWKQGWRFHVQNPVPLKICLVLGLLHLKSYLVAKHSPAGVVGKFVERVPAEVSSSSSDHGAKLRVLSQNSHCGVLKRH